MATSLKTLENGYRRVHPLEPPTWPAACEGRSSGWRSGRIRTGRQRDPFRSRHQVEEDLQPPLVLRCIDGGEPQASGGGRSWSCARGRIGSSGCPGLCSGFRSPGLSPGQINFCQFPAHRILQKKLAAHWCKRVVVARSFSCRGRRT